jgi:hypothetical protein
VSPSADSADVSAEKRALRDRDVQLAAFIRSSAELTSNLAGDPSPSLTTQQEAILDLLARGSQEPR